MLPIDPTETVRDEPNAKDPLWKASREGPFYETDDLVALRKWVESHGLELAGISFFGFFLAGAR